MQKGFFAPARQHRRVSRETAAPSEQREEILVGVAPARVVRSNLGGYFCRMRGIAIELGREKVKPVFWHQQYVSTPDENVRQEAAVKHRASQHAGRCMAIRARERPTVLQP